MGLALSIMCAQKLLFVTGHAPKHAEFSKSPETLTPVGNSSCLGFLIIEESFGNLSLYLLRGSLEPHPSVLFSVRTDCAVVKISNSGVGSQHPNSDPPDILTSCASASLCMK